MNNFTYPPDGIKESLLSILDGLLIKLSKTGVSTFDVTIFLRL